MAASTQNSPRISERWKHHEFPLAVGNHVYQGDAVGIDLSTGKLEPMHVEADLLYIGVADEEVDATSIEKPCSVDLLMEIHVQRWGNDAGSPVGPEDVGSTCNFLDNQTVTMGAGPNAGRIWHVDANIGVAVEKLPFHYVAP